MKSNKRKTKTERQKLIDKADEVFSKYIRHKYATGDYVACISCKAIKPIKEMQNGHYISRSHFSTRYYEKNCSPQCYRCNCLMKGAKDEHALALIKEHGPNILKELNKLKWESKKYTLQEFRDLIQKYGSYGL